MVDVDSTNVVVLGPTLMVIGIGSMKNSHLHVSVMIRYQKVELDSIWKERNHLKKIVIHYQKVELDSIWKERNHLKKIVEDMAGVEISDLKDVTITNESSDLEKVSTLEEQESNLYFKGGNRSANLKKVDTLDDKVSKLDLRVHQLISLLVVSWAIIVGFVAAKMI